MSYQITNLLTMEELKLLNPALWIVPRTFILKPGHSLLIGGLGRVDYLEVELNVVYCKTALLIVFKLCWHVSV